MNTGLTPIMVFIAILSFCGHSVHAGPSIEWEHHFVEEGSPLNAVMTASPHNSNLLVCVKSNGSPQSHSLPSVLLWWVSQKGERIRSLEVTKNDPNTDLKLTLFSTPCAVALEDGGALVLTHSQKGGMWLVRLDQAGKTISVKQLPFPSYVYIERIASTIDGNFLLIGSLNQDAFATKIDIQGNTIWENTYDYGRDEHFTSVLPAQDGGCVFVGNSVAPVRTVGGQSEVWAVKCDDLGKKQREKAFPGRNARAAKTQDGNYIIIYDTASDNDPGVWVRVLGADLNELWSKQVLAAEPRTSDFNIATVSNGDYVIAGMRKMTYFMAVLDQKGNQVWNFTDNRESRSFMCLDLIGVGESALACTSFLAIREGHKPSFGIGLLKLDCAH